MVWRMSHGLRPRKITDQQIEGVVTKTSNHASQQHALSTRLMAQEVGLLQNAIVRIWRAFDCSPIGYRISALQKTLQFTPRRCVLS